MMVQLRKTPSDSTRGLSSPPPLSPFQDPPKHTPRGATSWGGSQIFRLRLVLLCLGLLVVSSGLLYTTGYTPGFLSGAGRRASRRPFQQMGWGNMTREVLSRFGMQRVHSGLDGFQDILEERDEFLRRPRVLPSPPPPSPEPGLKRILAVTPTYARAFQELYITRLVSMVRTVAPPLLWIVVESPRKTEETAVLLNKTAGLCLPVGRPYCRRVEYVHIETGEVEKAKLNKAVVHRNKGLEYIEENRLEGVIYFMDDDNSYAPQLFEELRKIKWIGAMPVGFLYTQEYSRRSPHLHNTPIVERALVKKTEAGEQKVYGWETFEWFIPKPGQKARVFNIDMAGFGFSSEALWASPNEHGYPVQPVRFEPTHMGFLEDNFLLRLIRDASELEPLADGCTDVWVWHVHMEQESKYPYPSGWYVEQPDPQKLVRIHDDDNSIWPFVVNKTKFGIEGRGEKGAPFIYS